MKNKKLKKGGKVQKTDQNLQKLEKIKMENKKLVDANEILANRNTELNTKIEIIRTWGPNLMENEETASG